MATQWQKLFWKLVTNPTLEVAVALAAVAAAVAVLLQADGAQLGGGVPLFGRH